MGEKIEFKNYKEMPIRAMSVSDMTWNLTGSWRNVRPYYDFKVSPCRVGCPAGEDIQKYIFLFIEDRAEEAWRTIIEMNPMPAVTGRVCFHPCMEKCTRKDFDQSINIPGIERAIGDLGLENPGWMKKTKASKKEKVAVVGRRPARGQDQLQLLLLERVQQQGAGSGVGRLRPDPAGGRGGRG